MRPDGGDRAHAKFAQIKTAATDQQATEPPLRRLNRMNPLAIELFLLLNASASSPAWLLAAARMASQHLSTLALLALLPLAFLGRRARWQVCGVLLAMALAWLAARGMRETIPSVRPFMLGLGYQGMPHSASAGFPSMHATMAAAWAGGLCWFAAPRWRWAWMGVAVPVAVCIAWSRVYLGLHFPSDMGTGLLLGAVSGWLALTLSERLGLARRFLADPNAQKPSE
ncbi:MAG: phosphatase PAP2 family protein [Azonexus sp.]|uniref:phosphatase PAP2 family protein n=1 Tax=Hydrogenophaga sp. TaxID=1904254 RepID=UPI00272FDCE4|nr:phosphatase PAP2 family protein [Hydrogenophaga sp.]MDP3537226.1 phosphatase PAP2 family protein [Azonexus sp.]